MNDSGMYAVLRAIFSSIFDQVAIYRIVENDEGEPVDFVLENVNEAYITTNGLTRDAIIGRLYSEIWANEMERGFWNLMIKVARAGCGRSVSRHEPRSNYFEGTCTSIPGIYYQMFAFMPYPGKLVVILKDKSEWYRLTFSLKEKERLLLKYREDLRSLTARLTLAEERTRRSIATVLHDRIGYSMVTMVRALRRLYEMCKEGDLRREVDEVAAEMEKLVKEVRSFTFEISPTLLYDVGLEAALESLGEDFFSKQGVRYEFQSSGKEGKLPEDTKILLFQMVRELFVNIAKHAKASSVVVRIRRGAKKYQVVVEDDGIGFHTPAEKDFRNFSGMGLFSIRERLKSVGGQFSIVSAPDEGTIVSIVAPISVEHAVLTSPKEDDTRMESIIKSRLDHVIDIHGGRRAF